MGKYPIFVKKASHDMLYVRDKGQMCNNLLQYAHVYAWGREHGRMTMSMRFAYKYDYFHINHTRYHSFLRYLLAKWGAALGLLPVITFPFEKGQDTSRQEASMLRHRHAVVEGWRVEFFELFLKYRSDITRLFAFNDKTGRAALEKMNKVTSAAMAGSMNLGVHIRRGDYERFCGGSYFFDDATYISFIRQFRSLHPDRHINVFICGNDPHLDRKRFRMELTGMTVCFPDGSPGEDLCLLSHCDCLIGPPSTFSLVASMYDDIPLCWIREPGARLTSADFRRFDELFREIP